MLKAVRIVVSWHFGCLECGESDHCVRMGLGGKRLQNRSLLFLRPRRRMFNGYRLVLVFHSGQAESASAASSPAAGWYALATGRIADRSGLVFR